MRYLIGVDNTDSARSSGTGNIVRRLAEWLRVDRSGEPQGITRHQLLLDRRIPCTAHNSSVCLSIETENMEDVWETARDFLILEAASRSEAGLCLARWDSVSRDVIAFGRRAKSEVLSMDEAQQTAAGAHVRCIGLRGTGAGVIGGLAAVGLHREGNDGRFIWLPGLRELQGTCSVAEVLERTAIDRVCSLHEVELPADALIAIGEWTRPLLRNGQATLFVKQKKRGWAVLDKESVKNLSN